MSQFEKEIYAVTVLSTLTSEWLREYVLEGVCTSWFSATHLNVNGKSLLQEFSPLRSWQATLLEALTPPSLLLRGFLSLKKGTKCEGDSIILMLGQG